MALARSGAEIRSSAFRIATLGHLAFRLPQRRMQVLASTSRIFRYHLAYYTFGLPTGSFDGSLHTLSRCFSRLHVLIRRLVQVDNTCNVTWHAACQRKDAVRELQPPA